LPQSDPSAVHQAFKKFVEGKLRSILDPKIEVTAAVMGILDRLFELSFSCSAPTKGDRPNMKEAQESLWEIRKSYQAAINQQREGVEADSYNGGDPYDSVATTPRGRASPRPGTRRSGGGEAESVKARSSRRSEDSGRSHSNRHENNSNRGSHENPGTRENVEGGRPPRKPEGSVRTPRTRSPDANDHLDDIPSVQPIHVPNHRPSERRRALS